MVFMTMTVVVVIEKLQETMPLYKTAETSYSTFDKRKQSHVAGTCTRAGEWDFFAIDNCFHKNRKKTVLFCDLFS